jgi:hypothetical protein
VRQGKQAEIAKPPARGRSPVPPIDRSARDPALAPLDALGNAAVLRLLRSGRLAPKLSISQPGDPSERHAELVAERLLAGESCGGCDGASPCASCGNGLHRSAAGPADSDTEADAGRLAASLGSGIPLAPSLRSTFEAGLGRDLGTVRVHTSSAASGAAHALHAHAFTVGSDVAFASGKWAPDTPDGRRLLAHELAHVAQQEGLGGDVRRSPVEGEGGVCEAGEGEMNVCLPGEAVPAEVPPPKKTVSADEMLRGLGVSVPPKPFGPEPAPPPPEADVISGAAPLIMLSHPLADYPALFAALSPDDYVALEAAMRRRERIRDTQMPEPRTGTDLVQVPVADLLEPRVTSWILHPVIVGQLFEDMVEHPETADEGARLIAENDARRIFLETRLGYDVDITLEDPDAKFGGDTRLTLRVGYIELEQERAAITLASLDPLPGVSLHDASERAGHLAAQVADVAKALGTMDATLTKVEETAAGIIKSPEDYALNDAKALSMAAAAYEQYLTKLGSGLDPENDALATSMRGAVERFAAARKKANEAAHAAQVYFNEGHVSKSAGETYEEYEAGIVEEMHESGPAGKVVGGVGWTFTKAFEWTGRILTFGGMGMAERNARLYHEGKISYSAWKKNVIWDIGKEAVVAAITALTAGEGTGFALGALELEEGTAAAIFVTGTEKGIIGGFESAVINDVFSSLIAAGSTDPGVVAYQKSQIGGPSGWIASAAYGGMLGGPTGVVLSKGTVPMPTSATSELGETAAATLGPEEAALGPGETTGIPAETEITTAPVPLPEEVFGPPVEMGGPPSAVVEEPPPGSGVLAPETGAGTSVTAGPAPERPPLLLREGSSAMGRQLSNQSLDIIERRYGTAVRNQTVEAVSQTDFDRIGRSLGTRRNVYIADVSELVARDLRNYAGQLAIRPRATGTTPGMDLLALQPAWPPELVVPEVKMGASRWPYRIGRSNLPKAYRNMENFYDQIYEVLGDRNIPVGIRARIKMAIDAGRVRWEVDAIGNVRFIARGTNVLPGDVTVNVPIQVPRQ